MPGYTKKSIIFQKEQKEVYEKLLNFLDIKEDCTFNKYNIENNRELQENILSLKEDIKKFYSSSSCRGVNGKDCKTEILSIIKYILKAHKKEIYRSYITIEINNEKVRTQKFKIADIIDT